MVGLFGLAPVRFSSSFSLYPGLALAIPEPVKRNIDVIREALMGLVKENIRECLKKKVLNNCVFVISANEDCTDDRRVLVL